LAEPPAEDVAAAAEVGLRRTNTFTRALLGFTESMSREQVRFAAQTYSPERLLDDCYTYPVLAYAAALIDALVYEFVILQVAPPYPGPAGWE
jgi:hypothetical protein